MAPWLSANLGAVLQTRLPLAAVVHAQWRGGVFGRYDLLLRALVARQLLSPQPPKRATSAMTWYNQMQSVRAGRETLPAFRDLARAVTDVGLDPDFPIGLSPRGNLLDGAHRMGIALALNVPTVAVDIRPGKRLRSFERRWFVEAGLPEPALDAMDSELDRVMAETGVDTVLVTPAGDTPVREWLGPVLPAGMKVVREWSVSLAPEQAREVELALRDIPWHDKASQSRPVPQELVGQRFDVVRLRVTHHHFERIRKTSTARDTVAVDCETAVRQSTNRVVVVGQTYSHNRNALDILARHGWTHQAGTTWQ